LSNAAGPKVSRDMTGGSRFLAHRHFHKGHSANTRQWGELCSG
jgi:hypothetical protein